ncbi:MAG: hypothetical protein IPI69_11070 [Bacteroidales bacterium]|nr:hypothetical protein [Bacteroidales bacterium]
MYNEHTHSIENRIVNIYQPYVRPIVRGKDKAQVEFGAKLGVRMQNGYARINTLSWEAYNEGSDLKKQVEAYRRLNGYYPEVGDHEPLSSLFRYQIFLSGTKMN